ncbi:MAG: phosphatase PAP2 family protein [Bacteroidales bacterium]|nr:phosphatase PAP2 family protein [Bacteroidales bacterium]
MDNGNQSVKEFLTKNYFSFCLYAFILLGLLPLLLMPKQDINLLVNEHIANYFLDPFFIRYSQVFEGWCVVVIAIALVFVSKRKLLMFVVAGLLCCGITMLLKDVIIGNMPRPTKFLPLDSFSHILEDVSIYEKQYSFPSGHSTLAFSLMALFSSFSHRKVWCVCFFFVALFAAFSRIYLLQHFFVDVYAGACIGTAISVFVLFLFNRLIHISDSPLVNFRGNKHHENEK